jgi:hypothetical protein
MHRLPGSGLEAYLKALEGNEVAPHAAGISNVPRDQCCSIDLCGVGRPNYRLEDNAGSCFAPDFQCYPKVPASTAKVKVLQGSQV